MESLPDAKRPKLATFAEEQVEIELTCPLEVEDIAAEIISYLDIKSTLKLDLICKKFMKHTLWRQVKHLDMKQLCEQIFGPAYHICSRNYLDRIRPIVEKIVMHSGNMRSCAFYHVTGQVESQPFSRIESMIARHLTKAKFHDRSCGFDYTKLMLTKLNPLLLEELILPQDIASRGQQPFNLGFTRFKKLKRLSIHIPTLNLFATMDQIAATFRRLEHLYIVGDKQTRRQAQRNEKSSDEKLVAALSKVAVAHRATLKSLAYDGTFSATFWGLLKKKYEYNSDICNWAELERKIKADFVVPLAKLRVGDESLWSFHVSSTKKEADSAKFNHLFRLCYPTLSRSRDASRAITSMGEHMKASNLVFLLDTIINWLAPSWSWSRYDLDIFGNFVAFFKSVEQIIRADPRLATQAEPHFQQFRILVKEIVAFWPSAVLAADLTWILADLIDSDPTWAATTPLNYLRMIQKYGIGVAQSDRLFDLILEQHGDAACEAAPKFIEILKQPAHRNKLFKYLLVFRKHPKHLPLLPVLSFQNVIYQITPWGYILAALAADENALHQAMHDTVEAFGYTVDQYHHFLQATKVKHFATSEPLLSRDERHLAMFYFWKARLEVAKSNTFVEMMLDKFADAFRGEELPDRIKSWVLDPSSDERKTINTRKNVRIQKVKDAIREKWKVK